MPTVSGVDEAMLVLVASTRTSDALVAPPSNVARVAPPTVAVGSETPMEIRPPEARLESAVAVSCEVPLTHRTPPVARAAVEPTLARTLAPSSAAGPVSPSIEASTAEPAPLNTAPTVTILFSAVAWLVASAVILISEAVVTSPSKAAVVAPPTCAVAAAIATLPKEPDLMSVRAVAVLPVSWLPAVTAMAPEVAIDAAAPTWAVVSAARETVALETAPLAPATETEMTVTVAEARFSELAPTVRLAASVALSTRSPEKEASVAPPTVAVGSIAATAIAPIEAPVTEAVAWLVEVAFVLTAAPGAVICAVSPTIALVSAVSAIVAVAEVPDPE